MRERHVVRVGLRAGDQAVRLEGRDHALARLQRGHPAEPLRRGVRDPPVLADDHDLLEAVLAPDVEVGRVVPGRDLQGPGAELGLDVGVGDDLQPPADDRQDRRLPHQARVAVVVRVHGDRRVGEHGLRPHRGHGERPVPAGQRVVDVVERVGDLALVDLEVRDRRLQARIPVDHVVVAVDQALAVEVHEDLQDRGGIALVEREALVLVVARRAEALVLLDDRRAVLLAPLPDALDERLAAERLAARALGLQRLLDLALRRDAGVVGAEDPARAPAQHAVVADQRVLDRAVERVAHVQRPGDVRGRDRDRVVLGARAVRLGAEEPGLQPAREDPRLRLGGLVSAALQVGAHRASECRSPAPVLLSRRRVRFGSNPSDEMCESRIYRPSGSGAVQICA